MTLFTYLMLALLIAACSIPLLDVIASWYYLRFTQGVPAFGLTYPWARWAPGNSSPEAIQAKDSLLDEGGRAGFEPHAPRVDLASEPAAAASRMKDPAIGFDGHQYTFEGYRYDRFFDAIDHAELIRSRRAMVTQA
jgi:hypothetical protein